MRSIDWVERIAVGTSFACMVHCLALPFLFAALPSLARAFPLPESFHLWILLVAIPSSGFALVGGRGAGRSPTPLAIGVAGIFCLVVGATLLAVPVAETVVTVVGGSLLALAHALNWRTRHAASK